MKLTRRGRILAWTLAASVPFLFGMLFPYALVK